MHKFGGKNKLHFKIISFLLRPLFTFQLSGWNEWVIKAKVNKTKKKNSTRCQIQIGSFFRSEIFNRPPVPWQQKKILKVAFEPYFLKIWAIPDLFFFIFVSSIHLIVGRYKICWWLYSNRGPMVSEMTCLPTAPIWTMFASIIHYPITQYIFIH